MGISTVLDAESATHVGNKVTVDLHLPFFDPPPVTFDLPDLVNIQKEPASTRGVEVSISDADPSNWEVYWDHSSAAPAANAMNAISQCLQASPPDAAPTPMGNTGTFLKNVAKNAATSAVPCKVDYCTKNSSNQTVEYKCDYDTTAKQLTCAAPHHGL